MSVFFKHKDMKKSHSRDVNELAALKLWDAVSLYNVAEDFVRKFWQEMLEPFKCHCRPKCM